MFISNIFRKFKNKRNIKDPTLDEAKSLLVDNGYVLGYQVKSGKPYVVSPYDFRGNCIVIGSAGTGTGSFMGWLGFQQILKGGGLLYSSEYHDEELLEKLVQMCKSAGRLDDLVIINDTPDSSSAYSPVNYGEPDEIAARVLGALLLTQPSNAEEEYYRAKAFQALTVVIHALQMTGESYGPKYLALLLSKPDMIIELQEKLSPDSNAAKALGLFIDQFKCAKEGEVTIDMKVYKDALGEITERLHLFADEFANYFSVKGHPVNFRDAVKNNKIIYAPMPTMAKHRNNFSFIEMLQTDLLDAIREIGETCHKINPQFLLLTKHLYARYPLTDGTRRNSSVIVVIDTADRLSQKGKIDCFDEIENAIFFHTKSGLPIIAQELGSTFDTKNINKGEFFVRNRNGVEHLRFPFLRITAPT